MTPVKSSPQRLAEYDAVPLDQYDRTVWGNVAAVYTTMTHFDGPLRLLLKKRRNGTYFALITPAGAMTADTAMPTYTKRWRIENFFAENAFLGVEHLPSLNLNAIQTVLSLRLLAFHVVDNFRHDSIVSSSTVCRGGCNCAAISSKSASTASSTPRPPRPS